jgi:hypothetical protein
MLRRITLPAIGLLAVLALAFATTVGIGHLVSFRNTPAAAGIRAGLAHIGTDAAIAVHSPFIPVPTSSCATGVYTGYCGVQTNGNGRSLKVVADQDAPGARLRGLPDTRPDRGFDFYWFAYDGGGAKIAEYAPRGIASGLCMTETQDTREVILWQCTGALDQQWTFNGYGWANGLSGDVLTVGGAPSHLVGGVTPGVATKAETWTFSA